MPQPTTFAPGTWTVLLCGAMALFGCSDGGGDGEANPDAAGGFAGTGAEAGGSLGTGGLSLPGAPGAGGTGGGASSPGAYPCLQGKAGTCAGQHYMGQGLPLDIQIMFDQSGSMAIKDDGTQMRLDAVRGAVDQFLSAAESNGMGVGIGYFGHQPLTCGCTSCNPADYATPAVPLGLLPQHAPAVMGSLRAIEPVGETPTGAAIRGACTYASGRKQAEPGRNPVILLVTDGEPKAPLSSMKGGCNPTLEDAVAAASECAAAGIRTYVLGIGPSLENLNQIARAGATSQAYLVADGGGAEIVKALNAIRSDAMIPCALQIPRPPLGTVDHQKVNVLYSSAACSSVATFLNVKQPSGCDPVTGGWYYDNAASPTSIQLCPASCEAVKAPGGQLLVSVGCATQIVD